MADHAGLPGRLDQAALHGQLAVLHHLGVDVLAAGTVTGLALDAVLDQKSLVASPLLGIGTGGVATETDPGFERSLGYPAAAGDLLGDRQRQRRKSLGMFR
jgi:hypothetical protein